MHSPQQASRSRPNGRGNGRNASRGRGVYSNRNDRNESHGTMRAVQQHSSEELPAASGGGVRGQAQIGGPREQLTRTAPDLDRDARSSFDEMRGLLKSQAPWSREVEFCRQKSRSLHQTLIFHHPHHPLANSLDPLWIQTSYTLIAAFRDQVVRAESSVSARANDARGKAGEGRRGAGTEELKKVLTRFRQALASEEGFYRQLILRLVRHFDLEDLCRAALLGIGLPIGATGVNTDSRIGDGQGATDRPNLGKEEQKEKVALVYKALVCLGDVERYKEQYSDSYRREKASRGDAGRKGEEGTERFGRARIYYDVARGLLPEDGSAYNQLAVIATYLDDDLSVVYNYFRALAIRVPFKGVPDILDKCLKKAYEKWQEVEGKEIGPEGAMEEWRKEFVVLVSILYRQVGFSDLPSLRAALLPALSAFLRARQLPSEVIVQLSCISVGLHWHARSTASIRAGDTSPANAKKAMRAQQAEDAAVEWLLCVFTMLLSASATEIEGVMRTPGWSSARDEAIADEDQSGDKLLHGHISAVVRRLLPALRLFSKWLKLHLDYLTRLTPPPSQTGPQPQTPLAMVIGTFWSEYYRFIEAVAQVFPLGMLPGMKDGGLEEDEDMRGFLPIARGLAVKQAAGQPAEQVDKAEQVQTHPNEEQLMRIADLQVDATLILQAQTSGTAIAFEAERRADDAASVSTDTEDDPVNMAMRASLGQDQVSAIDDDGLQEPRFQPFQRSASDALHDLTIDPGQTPSAHHASLNGASWISNSALPSLTNQPSWTPTVPSPRGPTARPASGTAPASGPGSGPGSPGLLFGNSDNIWTMTREESSSQKGQRRDGSLSMGSQNPRALSAWTSEQQGALGGPGARVKDLWGAPSVQASVNKTASADFGSIGPVAPVGNKPQRETSQSGIARAGLGQPPPAAPRGMDAAQLFAGISGMGSSPWSSVAGGPGQQGAAAASVDRANVGDSMWSAPYGQKQNAFNSWTAYHPT